MARFGLWLQQPSEFRNTQQHKAIIGWIHSQNRQQFQKNIQLFYSHFQHISTISNDPDETQNIIQTLQQKTPEAFAKLQQYHQSNPVHMEDVIMYWLHQMHLKRNKDKADKMRMGAKKYDAVVNKKKKVLRNTVIPRTFSAKKTAATCDNHNGDLSRYVIHRII